MGRFEIPPAGNHTAGARRTSTRRRKPIPVSRHADKKDVYGFLRTNCSKMGNTLAESRNSPPPRQAKPGASLFPYKRESRKYRRGSACPAGSPYRAQSGLDSCLRRKETIRIPSSFKRLKCYKSGNFKRVGYSIWQPFLLTTWTGSTGSNATNL